MDTHILMAERRRVAEEFRARLNRLGTLRTRLFEARTDEARHYFYAAVDEEMAMCRGLGDKLLQLDASIQAMQTREVAAKGARPPSVTGAKRDPRNLPSGSHDPRSCTLARSNISDAHAHHDE
jgi:hypothetical protein